jgi:hypothetical protein
MTDESFDNSRARLPAVAPGSRKQSVSQARPSRVWVRATVLALACSVIPASRAAAATWSEPTTVSPEEEYAEEPRAAIDAHGDVAVVWRDSIDSYNSTIQLSVKPAGGSFSAPVTISDTPGQNQEPTVALGPEGQVLVVWESEDQRGGLYDEVVMSSSGSVAGGGFSQPEAIAYEGGSGGMLLGVWIGEHGQALAVWAGLGDNAHYALRAPGAGGFSAPVTLANPGTSLNRPSIAIANSGAALVAWTGWTDRETDGRSWEGVYTSVREAGQPFGATQTVEEAPCLGGEVDGAINEAAEAVVSWPAGILECEPHTARARASYRPPGGSFEVPVGVEVVGGAAVSPEGKITISGYGPNGSDSQVAVTRMPDGSYGSAEVISQGQIYNEDDPPVLAYDADGNLYAATDTRAWVPGPEPGDDVPDSGIIGNVAPAQGGFAAESSWLQTVRDRLDSLPVVAAAGDGQAVVIWTSGQWVELSMVLPESLVPAPAPPPESPATPPAHPQSPGPGPAAPATPGAGMPRTSPAPTPSTATTAQAGASPTLGKSAVITPALRLLAVSGPARHASVVVVQLLRHGHVLRSAHADIGAGRFRAVLSVAGLAPGRYRIEILLRRGRWERAEQRWVSVSQ